MKWKVGDRVRILWDDLGFGGRCGTIGNNSDVPGSNWVWVVIDGDSNGPRFLSPDEFELWENGLDIMLELVPG